MLLQALMFATPASAATWTVDHANSQLGFSVMWDREPFAGEFKAWQAEIKFDPADLSQAYAKITVDLASERSAEPDFDDGLKGVLGFEVSKFPQARFVTTRISSRGGDAYTAEGTLTLRGIAKSISLPFTLTFAGTTAHMVGKAVVLRTDFGIGRGPWQASAPVAHTVTVTVDLRAAQVK